jgi:flagellar protein FlaG
MSSDQISSVSIMEAARAHGTPPTSRTQETRKSAEAERNETAAENGQDVPLSTAGDAQDVQKVESAVSRISDFVQNFQRDLLFSIDKESDRLVVKVVDSETQEVIRQIPSEETLRIARNLDSAESLILREQA